MKNYKRVFNKSELITGKFYLKLHESKLKNPDKLSGQMTRVCGFLIKRYGIETTETSLKIDQQNDDFICEKWTLQITFINNKKR